MAWSPEHIQCKRTFRHVRNALSEFYLAQYWCFTFTKPYLRLFLSLYLLDFWLSALINGGCYERYLSIWFRRPWLFPCCKGIYFTAYLIGNIFIYFCNIVKIILWTPLRSLWQLLGLIVGPFMCCTKSYVFLIWWCIICDCDQ